MDRPQQFRRSSHHHAYSRKRRPSVQFRLQDLPVELRLLVLEHSLPPVNDVSRHWPAPIPSLLRTSKQINADTKTVMKRWSPVHYVPDPSYLPTIPYPGVVMVEDICLSLFHDARIGVLRSGPNTGTPSDDHQDLVMSWMNHIEMLPLFHTIQHIAIDATPAPGWLRYDKPDWVPNLVNDKAVSDRFIYEHIAVIADLITTITAFYHSLNHPDITVRLVGTYGHRSGAFPAYVQRRCQQQTQLFVPFSGMILPEPHRRSTPTMTIIRAINELYSTRNIPPQARSSRKPPKSQLPAYAKRRLTQYDYTPTTEFLFNNCFHDDEFWTMHLLERLTDFVLLAHDDDNGDSNARPRYIDVQIPDFAHGSLVCSLAKDLGLSTTPRSSWRRREIRVFSKTQRRARGARQMGRDQTSLFSLMLMSAAVVLFFGVLSSDMRRRR